MSELRVNTDGAAGGSGATPNFHHHRWNHDSLAEATRALAPADTAHTAAQWDALARDVDDASARFRASVDAALRAGWTGTGAAAVSSNTTGPLAALDDGAHRIARIARIVADAGSAMSAVVAAMPEAAPAPDPVLDWNSVLPWNWQAPADAANAEQEARDVFTHTYAPAHRDAAEALRGVADEALRGTADEALRGTADEAASAVTPADAAHSVPEDTGDHAGSPSAAAPAMDSGAATGMGALAGAAGGFAAQYGRRVVAAHRADTAASARPAEPEDDDTETVEPVFLEKMDDTTQLTGDLPPVAPPVIGER
ncbi:hypothetical protein [Rhodococcus sp. HNM0569]|uniref:hypothetical protein n=1 Tax=Rhodococcus sp. HNM0569 TaxID=2716340 RepID=UPI001698DBD7|nr:hypothetical protein [Rhodococcus sp. HNM0569]NLU84403.1 hypothetical protein [Rhodococcus sp. HNM0569]